MTKLDGTARGGVLVALADRFGLPIHAIGVGEQIDDLQSFEPAEFAAALTGRVRLLVLEAGVYLEREQGEEARGERDEDMRAQPRRARMDRPLQTDDATEKDRRNQPQHRIPQVGAREGLLDQGFDHVRRLPPPGSRSTRRGGSGFPSSMSDWIVGLEGTQAGQNAAIALALAAAILHAVFGAMQKGRHDPWLMPRGHRHQATR
jgi:hypothetical protein